MIQPSPHEGEGSTFSTEVPAAKTGTAAHSMHKNVADITPDLCIIKGLIVHVS